ncbi:MAG: hypothetical protein RLZZ385_2126 [Pseudomonadota bacterium]|jgi:hypothetical protein
MRNRFLSLPALVVLAACAAPSTDEPVRRLPTDAEVEQYNAQVDPEDRIVCRDEIRVGSNIAERVCRLVRDVEETSSFHREQLRNVLR